MVKRLLENKYVTAPQARGIELFILGTIFSFLFGILDNLELIMNGGTVDWQNFLFVFASTTTTAILAGFRKYLRDMQSKDLLP